MGAGEKGAALIVSALPAIPQNPANYPRLYAAARAALTQCEQVDEVRDIENRAAAMAAYASQANDTTLENIAKRIRARAVRRMGELLKEIPHRHGPGCGEKGETRTSVARSVGMSRMQQRQAAQIAQIPAKQFERLVESANPPKPYKLAELGVRKRTRRTEQSIRRALELAEEQVSRFKVRLVNAIAKVEALREKLGEFSREQTG